MKDGLCSALGLQLDEPEDHDAVALAGPAQRSRAVDDGRLEPDQMLALRVALRLEAD